MREDLCKKFCIYFNPSKKEDLACEGLAVIEKLLKIGKPVAFDEPDKMYDYASQKMLILQVLPNAVFLNEENQPASLEGCSTLKIVWRTSHG